MTVDFAIFVAVAPTVVPSVDVDVDAVLPADVAAPWLHLRPETPALGQSPPCVVATVCYRRLVA